MMKIKVNTIEITIAWYNEYAREQLEAINKEIDEYIQKNEQLKYDDVPIEIKASWWMRKASILWVTEKPLSKEFFKNKSFEYGALKWSESFFLNERIYL